VGTKIFYSIFCTENHFDENQEKFFEKFWKIFEKKIFKKYFCLNKIAANNGIKKLIKVVLLVGIYCSFGR
jgi:hypothetical protein